MTVTAQMIHCKVYPKVGVWFWCSFIYGFNDAKDREDLWADLRRLAYGIKDAWLIGGDFNAILNMEDRIGAKVRFHDIAPMRSCMAYCGFENSKTTGRYYTWNNKQSGEDKVFSKIDRAMGNHMGFIVFHNIEVVFLPEGDFDHSPIILCTKNNQSRKKPSRFYNQWCNATWFQEVVGNCWGMNLQGCKMFQVLQKLKIL